MIFNYYHIVNVENKKKYIGITEKTIEHRFKQHKSMLQKNEHPNYKLQYDWNKYGEKAFEFKLLESKDFEDIESGYAHEYELINSSDKELYNIAPGGQVNIMYNPEIRNKMIQTKQNQVPDIYCLEEIEENHFKIIGKFPSQKEAGRSTHIPQGTIQQAIKKHIKGCGYYWVEDKDIESGLQGWYPIRTKMRPVAKVNSKNEILEVHHNPRCFEKQYGYRSGRVSASICHGSYCDGARYVYIPEEQYYSLKPITLIK